MSKVRTKTYSQKPADVTRSWYVLDAAEVPLGRLSTVAASLLLGKGKPTVTPHVDGGDFVVVINTDKTIVTGDKSTDKIYYRHSGYPGGLTETSFQEQMVKDSREIIFKSVRGMLPVNKLRDGRLKRLKLYKGAEHEHAAQKPAEMSLKADKKASK